MYASIRSRNCFEMGGKNNFELNLASRRNVDRSLYFFCVINLENINLSSHSEFRTCVRVFGKVNPTLVESKNVENKNEGVGGDL